jgi:hypothetical protein
MDIKRKTCDIGIWKKNLFLDISSTNIDTLVPSLYRYVETRSMEVFWLLSQPLSHLRLNLFVISETFSTKVEPLYATNTSRNKQETFLCEYPLHWVLLPTKSTDNRTLLFGNTLLTYGHHFDYWTQPLNMLMRVCYLDCHEGRLCCYLVIHVWNLLHPLQLFYFHSLPIYWLSLVHTPMHTCIYICIYVHISTYIHICTCIYIHTCMHGKRNWCRLWELKLLYYLLLFS